MRKRLRIIVSVVLVAMVVLVGRLAWVQLVWGPDLSAKAVTQRERVYIEPARRGEILDRDGQRLAYTMKSRSLTVSPTRLRDELKDKAEIEAQNDGSTEGMDDKKLDSFLNQKMEETLKDMAEGIPKMIEDSGASTSKVEKEDILNKLKADTQYEVLVRNVDPDVAVEISNKYHGVAADRQDIRQYPNGAIGENVVGKVSMDGHGQFGFEAARDTELT
ncbi:MAG: penicillin-binding protein 2, partial [Corynebacterium sp.]|nr:penicillin-binding protein 2 [Corynebacterium sp.]